MTKRAGVTRKESLSVREDDLEILKARAKRDHGGNVSAVFTELITRLRREEAMRAAFEWYAEAIPLDERDRARIDRELFGSRPPRKTKRARGHRHL